MAILLASVVLLVICGVFYVRAPHGIIRCYLVRWSALDKIAPNVYVDPTMPEAQRLNLLSIVADAKKRAEMLYGEYTANPVVIAGHTMEVMEVYGGNSYNRIGRTYLTLVETFIILGPNGILSTDVLSHELAHAEFAERIGYWNRNEVPNWFDEGLAVQFDDRVSDLEWRPNATDGETASELDQLGIIKHDDMLAYARAKHEVWRWLEAVGQEGFLTLLQAVRSGDEFKETYHAIEQTYSTMQ